MKYLKLYESYKSIENICDQYKIKNYTINSDGSIDVDDDVDLRGNRFWDIFKVSRSSSRYESNDWVINEIPLNFRKVNGNFDCRYNRLNSLKGSPKECYNFYISHNNLTNLKGSPEIVNRFLANDNPIISLEYGPRICKGDYNIDNCLITSLKGSPDVIIDGYFGFSHNDIHTLDYLPKMVIHKDRMPHQSDESTIFMGGTPIYNLCKLFIDESIIMSNSIKYSSLESFFKSLDYGYLRNNVIDKYRFDQACDEVGIKMPDSIDGYIFK